MGAFRDEIIGKFVLGINSDLLWLWDSGLELSAYNLLCRNSNSGLVYNALREVWGRKTGLAPKSY